VRRSDQDRYAASQSRGEHCEDKSNDPRPHENDAPDPEFCRQKHMFPGSKDTQEPQRGGNGKSRGAAPKKSNEPFHGASLKKLPLVILDSRYAFK